MRKDFRIILPTKEGLFFFLLFILMSFNSFSNEIIGGSLTYNQINGTSYSIQLKLFEKCSATPPAQVKIGVRDENGNYTGLDFNMLLTSSNPLTSTIDSCTGIPTQCTQKIIYTKTISLPVSSGGYHLFYEGGPRSASITNIYLPLSTGTSFNTFIPNVNNSSPQWNNPPPSYLCVNTPLTFDFSASDADGDSLVYSFYTPYNDSTFIPNNPSFDNNPAPDNIHFTPIVWMSGYTETHPFNASPSTPLLINSQTGILTGVPQDTGRYLVGIKCDEYRNGLKIGEIERDYTFRVKVCPVSESAIIGHLNGCNGNIIPMQNASPNWATNFQWDFGDGSSPVSGFEPTHTYPGDGVYTVSLIANSGTPCADTSTSILKVGTITANFNAPDSVCISDSVLFTPTSTTTGSLVPNSWNWDFGDSTTTSTDYSPLHQFDSAGIRNVKLVVGTDGNCYGIAVKSIYVEVMPAVHTVTDTFACQNSPAITLTAQIENAVGTLWQGNGTFSPSPYNATTIYSPTASEITNGSATILVNTTGNSLCQSAQQSITITYAKGSTISIGYSFLACSTMDSIPLTASYQYATGMHWYTSNGGGSFSDINDPLTFYFPSYSDILADSIQIIGETTTSGGCSTDADTIWISFAPPNTIAMNAPTKICEGEAIHLHANSSTGLGAWSTPRDGTYTADTANNTIYSYGPADFMNGNTLLYFKTINNGGCPPQYDTIVVAINQLPHPGFNYDDVCFGFPTHFYSDVYSNDAITNYIWKINGSIFALSNDPVYTIPTSSTTSIQFIVKTTNGCIDSITKAVKTNPDPSADFALTDSCLNSGNKFTDLTTITGEHLTQWNWNFGDNTTSTERNPSHPYLQTGTYTIKLVVDASDGCKDSITKTISIHTSPHAQFNISPTTSYPDKLISFTDQSSGSSTVESWLWNFGDGNTGNQQSANHSYTSAGKYTVILIVKDSNNCRDTLKRQVAIYNRYFPPNVPTAFSPNGDGNNDVLYVYGGSFDKIDFSVYNNWGQLLFDSTDKTKGWNGTYNGKKQPEGVYIWTIKATTYKGDTKKLKGNITLMR